MGSRPASPPEAGGRLICMIGPPADPARDDEVVRALLAFPGAKAVCGGTTSSLVARVLGEEIQVRLKSAAPGLPPAGSLPGIDLVCEGVITLNRVLEMLDERGAQAPAESGAAVLHRLLRRAETIRILFGQAANPIRQPVATGISDKKQLVLELRRRLRELGKKVDIEIF